MEMGRWNALAVYPHLPNESEFFGKITEIGIHLHHLLLIA